MPNDPDKFNNFNGMNNSDKQDDFIDSSFAVQFKPGDKTESIADKLKESKENLEKKNSSFNNGFKDEFDDFEFDSSISAFKPFKAPEEPAAPVKEEPKPEAPKAEAPKAPVSTAPAFPKDGGTFDKPLFTAKAPEPAKNSIPKFDDLDEALDKYEARQANERIFKSGNGLDFATSEHDKKTSPFLNAEKPDIPAPNGVDIPRAEAPKAPAAQPAGFRPYPSANKTELFNTPTQNAKAAQEAEKYGERLFNASDDAKYSALDYINYGTALQKLKKNEQAIATFQKVLDTHNFDMDSKVSVFKNISDVYKSMADYPKALEYYEKYVKGNQGKMTANIKNGLAQLYRTMAIDENTAPEQKQELVEKADKVFAEIAKEFPTFEQSVTAQRAKLPFILDPEDKAGAAKPHYDKLIEIINGLDSKDASDMAQLKQALSYNIVYFVKVNEDIPKAKEYAAKLLEIDPENAMAKQVADLQ